MISVPEYGVVVGVCTDENGAVEWVAVQPLLESGVLYFSMEQVAQALEHGSVLQFARSNGHTFDEGALSQRGHLLAPMPDPMATPSARKEPVSKLPAPTKY